LFPLRLRFPQWNPLRLRNLAEPILRSSQGPEKRRLKLAMPDSKQQWQNLSDVGQQATGDVR
jgi:hypothetical protein